MISAFSWAVYSVLLKRERLARLGTLPLFAMIALAGSALLVPPMLYEVVVLGAFPNGLKAWAMIVALAIFPSVLAFGLYQYGVKRVGPSVTGVYLYLLPLYGVAAGLAHTRRAASPLSRGGYAADPGRGRAGDRRVSPSHAGLKVPDAVPPAGKTLYSRPAS